MVIEQEAIAAFYALKLGPQGCLGAAGIPRQTCQFTRSGVHRQAVAGGDHGHRAAATLLRKRRREIGLEWSAIVGHSTPLA